MEFKLKRFENVMEVTRIANIHYFEFTRQFYTFQDKHAFRELIYVDSGTIQVESDGYSGLLRKNQLVIHKANETHSLSCPEDEAPNVIIIGFECKNSVLDIFSSRITTLSSELQKILTEIIREGRNVFLPPYDIPNMTDMKKRHDYPFGADQMIKNKLEEFFISLIRYHDAVHIGEAPKHSSSNIMEVASYIDKNFKEKITLEELCFLFGTNKTSLCYDFKAVFHDTLISYINRLRIKEAKKLLREDKLNMTQISAAVGFSSIHYFSKIFKHYENKSPSEYINTIKSNLNI